MERIHQTEPVTADQVMDLTGAVIPVAPAQKSISTVAAEERAARAFLLEHRIVIGPEDTRSTTDIAQEIARQKGIPLLGVELHDTPETSPESYI